MRTVETAAAPETGKPTRNLQPAAGEELLVHDGKHIIVCHGSESHTGTGNPAFTMVTGSPREIDEEIKRLGLTTADSDTGPGEPA